MYPQGGFVVAQYGPVTCSGQKGMCIVCFDVLEGEERVWGGGGGGERESRDT